MYCKRYEPQQEAPEPASQQGVVPQASPVCQEPQLSLGNRIMARSSTKSRKTKTLPMEHRLALETQENYENLTLQNKENLKHIRL